jgi:hypothetical protein
MMKNNVLFWRTYRDQAFQTFGLFPSCKVLSSAVSLREYVNVRRAWSPCAAFVYLNIMIRFGT